MNVTTCADYLTFVSDHFTKSKPFKLLTTPSFITLPDLLQNYLFPFIGFFGIAGNLLNLYVLTSKQRVKPSSVERSYNCGLVALAGADLTVCVLCTLKTFLQMEKIASPQASVLPIYFNTYLEPLINAAINASVWFTTCIALNRYFAICRPLSVRSFVNPKIVRLSIVLIIVFSVACNIPRALKFHVVAHPCRQMFNSASEQHRAAENTTLSVTTDVLAADDEMNVQSGFTSFCHVFFGKNNICENILNFFTNFKHEFEKTTFDEKYKKDNFINSLNNVFIGSERNLDQYFVKSYLEDQIEKHYKSNKVEKSFLWKKNENEFEKRYKTFFFSELTSKNTSNYSFLFKGNVATLAPKGSSINENINQNLIENCRCFYYQKMATKVGLNFNPTVKYLYNSIMSIIGVLIPFVVMSLCNFCFLRAIKKSFALRLSFTSNSSTNFIQHENHYIENCDGQTRFQKHSFRMSTFRKHHDELRRHDKKFLSSKFNKNRVSYNGKMLKKPISERNAESSSKLINPNNQKPQNNDENDQLDGKFRTRRRNTRSIRSTDENYITYTIVVLIILFILLVLPSEILSFLQVYYFI